MEIHGSNNMSYLGRRRKPAQPKAKNARKRPLRAPSMQLDHIMCEHGECKAVWRNEAKDLTLWAKFVKWVRGWHG